MSIVLLEVISRTSDQNQAGGVMDKASIVKQIIPDNLTPGKAAGLVNSNESSRGGVAEATVLSKQHRDEVSERSMFGS